jgi:alkylated DNA repair dioxygenase AlkB
LFTPSTLQVVADPEGGIRYWPDFAARDEADRWFGQLHAGVEWLSSRRRMYDHVVDVPRLTAGYGIDALPSGLPIGEILERVNALRPAPYNAVGLNLYRDGRDSVAMHNDKLHTIVPGQPIALVSLGATRRMAIRSRSGNRRSVGLDLAPGSLLAMSHASQLSHEHGIPKVAAPLGPRISLVFRVRPTGWNDD